jgi:hypothetical protein
MAAINSAKLVLARGRLALGRGDRDTAIASAEMLGSLARSHQAESATIMLVIGLVIERLHLALVHELLTSAPTTPQELDRLEASMGDEDLIHAARQALRGNAAAIAHDVGSPSTLWKFHDAIHRSVANAFGKIVAAAAIESYRDAEKRLGQPIRAPRSNVDEETGHEGWWHRFLSVYGANFDSVSARSTSIASARDLAHLAIALRRQALAAGHYPATLPAMAGVPVNDSLSGEPRAYELRADGSAELRSTTTAEIVRSISPGAASFFESLYRFTLPAPHRGHVT